MRAVPESLPPPASRQSRDRERPPLDSPATPPYPLSPNFCLIRPIASTTLSRLLNADRRKYPSPAAPNPEPGVPTTWHSRSSLSKHCQLDSPAGVFSHTYGALTP